MLNQIQKSGKKKKILEKKNKRRIENKKFIIFCLKFFFKL
jgi:hypothetical protein